MARQITVLAFLVFLSSSASAQVSAPLTSEADRLRRQEYDIGRLGVYVGTEASAKGTKSPKRWTLAYEGKEMKPLQGTAFYEKIGREDLVLAYRNKQTLKTALSVTGGVLLGAGLLFELGAALISDPGPCTGWDCIGSGIGARVRGGMALTGLGLAGGGVGLLVVGLVINPNPVDALEAQRLVDDYNRRLRDRLGLSSESESAPKQQPVVRIQVAPAIASSGGGLSLRLSF